MPKKKVQISAYSLFMKDKQKELGGKISMSEVASIAAPLWKKLSDYEREEYNDRAKRMKQQTGRMTSDGTPLVMIEAAEQEMENQIKQMQADVKALIYHLSIDELLEMRFYVISFNILVATSDDYFLPNEIGLVEYSLQNGILKSYHRFIDPGPIPTGFTATSKEHSEMTHKIPFLGFELQDSDYKEIFDNILDFTNATQGRVMIFSHNEQLNQNRCCFSWLMKMAGYSNSNFYLADLTMLLMELRNSSGSAYAAKVCAIDALNSNNFDFVANTRCEYHEDLDNPYCALGFSRRLCFMLSDQLANVFEIDLTSSHMPERIFEFASMVWRPTGPLKPVRNIVDVPLKPIVKHVPTTIIPKVRSQYASDFEDDEPVIFSSKMNSQSPPKFEEFPEVRSTYQPSSSASSRADSPQSVASSSARVTVASRLASNFTMAPLNLKGAKKPTTLPKLCGMNMGRGKALNLNLK